MTEPTKHTAGEIEDSLTGYDEDEIAKHFGDLLGFSINHRGLLFIVKRREGLTAAEAKKAVMEMRAKDVLAAFSDEDDEDHGVGYDELTDAGKDEQTPESEQMSSQLGA